MPVKPCRLVRKPRGLRSGGVGGKSSARLEGPGITRRTRNRGHGNTTIESLRSLPGLEPLGQAAAAGVGWETGGSD
jgi:hypothetical protein